MKPSIKALLLDLFATVMVVNGIVEPSVQSDHFTENQQSAAPVTQIQIKNGVFSCGGSILSSTWLVTAAHCVSSGVSIRTISYGGTTHFREGGQSLEPAKVFLHKADTVQGSEYDVALVKLKDAIKLDDTMQTIELNQEDIPTPAPVTILGKDKSNSERLKPFTMLRIPDEVCGAKGVLCLDNRLTDGGLDCDWVPGSPVVYDDKQVAVVSFGATPTACGSGKPIAFTRVTSYYDWAVETMKD